MTRPSARPARQDLYPSRVGGAGGILERRDPVLHGDREQVASGPFGAEDLSRFERDGFLVCPSVFPADEVEGWRTEMTRLMRARQEEPSPELVREPSSNEIRSIFRVHATSEVFAHLARDARLVKAVEQILGSPVYVHQSRINLKPGFEGEEFYWHSDFETWHVEDGMRRMRAVSCAINLDHNYDCNGALMLIRGSHRYFVACPGRTPENHYLESLRKQEYGVPEREALRWLVERGEIVTATGPPGSVTFFECNVMHGSGGNITPFPRSNVFFVFNSVENAIVEPFCGLAPRPDFIATRDPDPIAA